MDAAKALEAVQLVARRCGTSQDSQTSQEPSADVWRLPVITFEEWLLIRKLLLALIVTGLLVWAAVGIALGDDDQ